MGDAQRRRFDPAEARMDDRQGFGNVQKQVRLFLRKDFLDPVVAFFPLPLIERPPSLLQQFVHFAVPVGHEV